MQALSCCWIASPSASRLQGRKKSCTKGVGISATPGQDHLSAVRRLRRLHPCSLSSVPASPCSQPLREGLGPRRGARPCICHSVQRHQQWRQQQRAATRGDQARQQRLAGLLHRLHLRQPLRGTRRLRRSRNRGQVCGAVGAGCAWRHAAGLASCSAFQDGRQPSRCRQHAAGRTVSAAASRAGILLHRSCRSLSALHACLAACRRSSASCFPAAVTRCCSIRESERKLVRMGFRCRRQQQRRIFLRMSAGH